MGRPKGSKNKRQTGISYPRKCELCDYMSNNPAMYSYHKQTHAPIPDGTMCEYGCGNPARFRGTGGKYRCSEISHRCPKFVGEHSKRVADQWKGDSSRKEKTKVLFAEHCSHNEDARNKLREVLRLKSGLLTAEEHTEYRHYARALRAKAQKWAKSQGFVLGQKTAHVDHILSIKEAWGMRLPESIVNHPANLQVIDSTTNIKKGMRSSHSLEELMEKIRQYDMNLNVEEGH